MAFRPFTQALLSHFREAGPPEFPELAPFRSILARLVPEWRDPDGPPADDSIVLLAEAILRLVRAVGRDRGCMVLLEDLHWTDFETTAIAEYLADNLEAEPVIILGTLRPEPSAGFNLVQSLVARRNASAIDLRRLGPDEVGPWPGAASA